MNLIDDKEGDVSLTESDDEQFQNVDWEINHLPFTDGMPFLNEIKKNITS